MCIHLKPHTKTEYNMNGIKAFEHDFGVSLESWAQAKAVGRRICEFLGQHGIQVTPSPCILNMAGGGVHLELNNNGNVTPEHRLNASNRTYRWPEGMAELLENFEIPDLEST